LSVNLPRARDYLATKASHPSTSCIYIYIPEKGEVGTENASIFCQT